MEPRDEEHAPVLVLDASHDVEAIELDTDATEELPEHGANPELHQVGAS